ncbi:amidohydrolase [Kitasatospora sp. MMS16-BH015]|uniref:amidohydrolase n=1 Tax=Kitasatospora sp. MMS16-BH015 TaxID=2018025 RepID=UPI000CA38CF3|nr:amidohydrolase [Kitasatospora sp. MMS16-BH015]AUG75618.1 amidohydrolase [Kitasatospora sp. MMS16-BH015]
MTERTNRTVLLRGGNVHSPADPFATAMLVEGEQIAWVGSDGAAETYAATADEVIELAGALVTPAFVDAHVHATSAGLALTGLDLTDCRSLPEALRRIAEFAAATEGVLIGHGWDETKWPEGRPPTLAELDEACGGAPLYLSRTDVHSALASGALRSATEGLAEAAGYHPDGPLTKDAHHAVRQAALTRLTPAQRRAAQLATLTRAAQLGIGALHECSGPEIASEQDLAALLELAAETDGPEVFAYWGELAERGGVETARRLGAIGAGGDLFVDGALGSHTACLHTPYSDAEHTGTSYLTAEQVADHVTACTEAGLQAGFHAIGDAALAAVIDGVRTAADRLGLARVKALRHRVEHAEALDDKAVAAFAELGLTASVQPAFDAAWGGPEGMYVQRLGAERAAELNPFAAMLRAGVPLAFGSDAPVTPLDPWGSVRAAAFHQTLEHRISVRAAFAAHTRGGWRAIGRDQDGVLVPGAVASYAIWAADDLVVQAPDSRVAGWSTDPRSGTPGLPDLTPGEPLPQCLRTVVRGKTVFQR